MATDIHIKHRNGNGGRPRKPEAEKLIRADFLAPAWMIDWLKEQKIGMSNAIRYAITKQMAERIVIQYDLGNLVVALAKKLCDNKTLTDGYKIEQIANLLCTYGFVPETIPKLVLETAVMQAGLRDDRIEMLFQYDGDGGMNTTVVFNGLTVGSQATENQA